MSPETESRSSQAGRLSAMPTVTEPEAERRSTEPLAEVICRIGEFAADQQDRIAELDVNPLICAGARIAAVDALIVLRG